MSYSPNNANGQATMANSAPVVIASNQTAVPVSLSSGATLITTTITHETAPYAIGDLLGGKLTFANAVTTAGGSGTIKSFGITDKDSQSVDLWLFLFSENPTNTTFTENSPVDIHDTDLLNLIAVVTTGSYFTFVDNSFSFEIDDVSFKLTSGTSLYGFLMCRGAPTYTTTTALQLRLLIQ